MAGFNLVAVVDGEGLCLHWDGALRPVRFGRGSASRTSDPALRRTSAHVISSNYDLDDPSMPEKAVFDRWVAGGAPTEARLKEFLSSHDGARPVCKDNGEFGTVSSTIYIGNPPSRQEAALRRAGRLLHADGPPCRTPFAECSALLE